MLNTGNSVLKHSESQQNVSILFTVRTRRRAYIPQRGNKNNLFPGVYSNSQPSPLQSNALPLCATTAYIYILRIEITINSDCLSKRFLRDNIFLFKEQLLPNNAYEKLSQKTKHRQFHIIYCFYYLISLFLFIFTTAEVGVIRCRGKPDDCRFDIYSGKLLYLHNI